MWFGVERTRWGAMVRAAVDNRGMAQSVGINTRLLFMLTFALGSGLAGLGGALGADILPVQWAYPFEHLVYFLIVVAVGGLGSLRGPFIAALLIGIADTACKYWIPEFGAFLSTRRRSASCCGGPWDCSECEYERASERLYRRPAHPLDRVAAVGRRALAFFFLLPEYLSLGARILIFILFALSLDLILGYAGIVTLGHSAFFGLGAYTAGMPERQVRRHRSVPAARRGRGRRRRCSASPRARSSCARGR